VLLILNSEVTGNQHDEQETLSDEEATQEATLENHSAITNEAATPNQETLSEVKLDNDLFEQRLAKEVAPNNLELKICLEEVKAKLEHEGHTDLLNCLQALFWQKSEGLSITEISEKIGRRYNATKTYLSECRKRLMQYPPLQECEGVFLKMCLEKVKANLERDGSNAEIVACLQAYLSKLSGKSIRDIALQTGKTNREINAYLSKCKKKLRQHPAIPEKCRAGLKYLE
jgi:DNA-directed RNA polymerase specialized sigma24 family protein